MLSVTVGEGGCTLSTKEEAFSDRNENCPFSACLNCPVSAGPELLISVKPMQHIDLSFQLQLTNNKHL